MFTLYVLSSFIAAHSKRANMHITASWLGTQGSYLNFFISLFIIILFTFCYWLFPQFLPVSIYTANSLIKDVVISCAGYSRDLLPMSFSIALLSPLPFCHFLTSISSALYKTQEWNSCWTVDYIIWACLSSLSYLWSAMFHITPTHHPIPHTQPPFHNLR